MKYLSKLLSMLLIGGMLFATGCTDYDQDIKDINRELNEINDQLNGRVNALAADLDAVEAALQAAIDEANQKVAENKEAIEDLQAVDAEHDAAIAEANQAIADAIADHNADIDAVYAKINEANTKITANETAIEGLKTKDAELAQDIEEALAAIQINVDAIAENKEDIAKLQNDLLDLSGSFTAYQATIDAAIADFESHVETAEAAIATLEDTVETLAKMQEEQAGRIDDLENDYEEFKKFTQDELAALTEADMALEELIVNLENSFISYQKIVNEQFTKAFAEIAANTNAINTLAAKHEEEVKSLQAQDAAILNTLDQHVAWLVELEENLQAVADRVTANENEINSIKGQIAKIQTNIEQMQVTIDALIQDLAELEKTLDDFQKQVNEEIARLDAAIEKALADAKAYADDAANAAVVEAKGYTDTAIEALTKSVNSQLDEIRKSIADLDAYAVSIEEALNAYKESNDKAIDKLKGDINKILNRVQSIVFVPEYSDGKGTINYAMAGNTIVEGRSTMVYQVYPAECAALIANAVAVIDDEATSPLSFIHQDLKNRDTRADNHKFNIVGVTGDVNGRLVVTVDARNLGADFYAGEMEYAVALVLETENENLSSCFTNVVPGNPEKITMSIVTPDVDGKDVDITNTIVEPNLTIEYNDTTDTKKILENHKVKFTVGGKDYYGIEALNAAGYALDLDVKPYAGTVDAPSIDPFKVADPNNDGIIEVSVAKVDEALIGPDHAVEFGYTYTAGGLVATTGRRVETTPITAKLTFEPVEVTWTYANDAAVDAAFFADKAQTAVVYERDQLPLKATEENTLPEDTTIEDVLSTLPAKVVVNETELKDDSTLKIGFNAEGELAVLAIRGFAFEGEPTYNIVATYELHNVTVTVKATVVTKDRNRAAVNVTIQESTTDVCKNLEFTMRDPFAHVYDAVAAGTNMGEGIDAKHWMTENFITKAPVAKPTIAGLDCSTWKYAYFKVHDWEYIDAVYSYRSSNYLYEKAGWTIPTDLNYACTFTTWYGQVINVSKVVKFNLPKFDFAHNEYYVFEDDTRFYSQVAPEYTFNPEGSDAIETYTVANVELKNAFLVIDENNQILDKALMEKYGLVVEYIIEDEKHPGIEMVNGNEIVYLGSMDEVNVYGYLYIQNSDSAKTRIQLPTSFDNNDAYGDYVVKKFNPILDAVVTPCVVNVNNDKPFTVNPLNYISLGDDRRGAAAIKKSSYDLIDNKLGAWVMGDGENGFAADYSADEVYGLGITWSWSEASVPAQLKDQFVWNADNTLTFKNTNNMALTKDVKLNITLTIENVWMEPQEIKVPVTFHPAQGFTPAE